KNDEGENVKAIVTLPSDQKSKAIGKGGINIRLASMLCGMEIELVENDDMSGKDASETQEEQKESVDALEALFN
ncbi:MAG: transcription termination/antitermination protein NusA, partial [Sulfurimonas sp.]